jgi:hypothetical protein
MTTKKPVGKKPVKSHHVVHGKPGEGRITCRKCGKTGENNWWGSTMYKNGKEILNCPFCGNTGPYRRVYGRQPRLS